MSCVIGLDIGTTSTIGIVLDVSTSRIIASATRPVTLLSPKQGWAEEEPNEWWANVCSIVPELLHQSGLDRTAITAIGTTGMLPATIVLDSDGTVLRPSIQQSDGRTGQEVKEIAGEVSEDAFVMRAGNGINQQLVASRIRWIEKHEPEVFNQIATVFGSYDYINWRLTGERAVEQNWALEAGFIDLETNELSDDLISLAHLTPGTVPKKAFSSEIIGHVSAEAAAQSGLAEGTPVVGGAADHIASAYAAGVLASGDVLLKFGGAADIMIATDKARPDPRMFLDYHIIPGLFMPNGCMSTGGSALNWFIAQFAKAETAEAKKRDISPHQYLDGLAAEIPPGSDGVTFIPYLLGEKTPIHDPDARGTILGLSLNHDIRHLWRALLEGYAYAFRHHVEVFNDMGFPTTRFLASDGGSKSALWMQICADVLQTPVQLLTGHPGSCLGAAWLAGMGTGATNDWSGVAKCVSYGAEVQPNTGMRARYDAGYALFRETYEMQKELRK
ncbi:MAG: FGGY-family carbohydrate kinase [Sulfitobacter sp.]|uniref:FGGY-family carbohydrate kinase n=1 Tax=Alphaproteobacteria TaxID=28211 RepID=UPI0029437BA8|nr:FGGY-family carbohydrate kinase [Sulfitobacter sp. LC.270.F.C4]WOI16666.1 FGGY-family carbohydrate kinase [Sulfitobacter sp. LC.270.F.C4]